MKHRVERKIGDATLSMETGHVAKQADGAVLAQLGDTIVLVTAVSSEPREVGEDFFPLTTDYREKLFAAGKFPGGFFKREGRPSTKEVLTSRLMDRPIRPLFPETYHNEVAVNAVVLSADQVNDSDILAVNGASAALCLSTIPFNGPLGAVRIGLAGDQFVVNPTYAQREQSKLDLIVVGDGTGVTMIEGDADELPEEKVLEALKIANEYIVTVCDLQRELMGLAGKAKQEVPADTTDPQMLKDIKDRYFERVKQAFLIEGKLEKKAAIKELSEQIMLEVATGEDAAERALVVAKVYDKLVGRAVRELALEGRRVDGRDSASIRELVCEVGVLPRTHGSAIFQRGETQALVIATLGTAEDEQVIDGLAEEYKQKFMVHYNFPAFSVGETWPSRGPKRREIGHGALAERCLAHVIPEHDLFPYTIRIVSEIMESNGSSSMATVCGGTLALMDAGIPIKNPVAGISVGLVKEGAKYVLLTDIVGEEDHYGDMDFKIAGTQNGITGIQLDLKIAGINEEIIAGTLERAKAARMELLRAMLTAIRQPRPELSAYAPRLVKITIPSEKIGKVIGPGGSVVRRIQEETGTKIEITDDVKGTVVISGSTDEGVAKAKKIIEGLTEEAEIGRIYEGEVTSVRDFGAFVEILPGTEGMVHISELADGYVERVTDVVHLGDRISVKVIDIDDMGKIRLSKRAVDAPEGQGAEPRRRPEGRREGGRRDGGGHRGGGRR
jgi:polyribonucleotide nucleotidyltransferase